MYVLLQIYVMFYNFCYLFLIVLLIKKIYNENGYFIFILFDFLWSFYLQPDEKAQVAGTLCS